MNGVYYCVTRINCEILDLRAFLAVLEIGSFQKAASVLNLSQSALSRRIKSFERTLGSPLLERATHRAYDRRPATAAGPDAHARRA